jgi:hypothetical protein
MGQPGAELLLSWMGSVQLQGASSFRMHYAASDSVSP